MEKCKKSRHVGPGYIFLSLFSCQTPVEELRDESGEKIPDTRRADMLFQMQIPKAAAPYTIVRSARIACSGENTDCMC